TVLSLEARAEAERQRAEAEGLIEVMLTDLGDRLEGGGRLDVLAAVSDRAPAYYEVPDLGRWPAGSPGRRARGLHRRAGADEARGDLDRAAGWLQEARRPTAAQLEDDPANPSRVLAHAQTEGWVGRVAYRDGRRDDARAAFSAYRDLTARLVAMAPA